MAEPTLSRLELKVMEALWDRGACSIRELQEHFPPGKRPAYTTVQTVVYRLEEKGAVHRARKIGNAHIFEPLVSRNRAHGRLLDELLGLFGGRAQPLIAHLIESGRLTMDDIEEARRTLRRMKPPRANKGPQQE
jgi:BlaI family transcriptional regulator, penicillinase repressor